MAGTLYLVPTPIGNLDDISLRMARTLEQVDFIAAEDTRVSVKLLNHLNLKKQMIAYHRHNVQQMGEQIIARILGGESCALISDAGTPAISDPGEELVQACILQGIAVCAIAGPCALITALAASGQPTGRFTFEGFLPMNKKNRAARLASLQEEQRTMIFYEAPHKLLSTLQDFCACFGAQRPISLCRELSKVHEEFVRLDLQGAVQWAQEKPPRGEFVLVVQGAQPKQNSPDPQQGLALVQQLREEGVSLRDAVRQAAKTLSLPRNQLYDMAVEEDKQE